MQETQSTEKALRYREKKEQAMETIPKTFNTQLYSINNLAERRSNNKTPAKHRDIFRDTLIAKKVWRRRGPYPEPTGWETKNIQAPARVRTLDLQPD